MQPNFSRENNNLKNKLESFQFPNVGQYPIPADFHTILKDYQVFLKKNKLVNNQDSWNKSFDAMYNRYQYHIGVLDHSKSSFKKLLQNMEDSNAKSSRTIAHTKNVHDYYAQQQEERRLDELRMLGRADEDGYVDY
jgi:hypothetical protein